LQEEEITGLGYSSKTF